MKAYNKQEVDSTFSNWQDDLNQLDVLEVVPLSVLDKIRAEIEALTKTYPFVNHIDTYVKEDDVKKIIDKYKAESEDKE